MMASRILSRFLPGAESSTGDHILGDAFADRALESGPAEEPGDRFRDSFDEHDLNDMLLDAVGQSEMPGESVNLLGRNVHMHTSSAGASRSQKVTGTRHQEEEDDVPASLIMESNKGHATDLRRDKLHGASRASTTDAQWKTAQHQQRLHDDISDPSPRARNAPSAASKAKAESDPREHALWRWTNIQNVDGFLLELYQYFTDHGIWSVLLSRAIYIMTTAFLFSLYMFLSTCIDFTKIPQSKSTSEVLIPQCMKNTTASKNIMLWLFTFWWLWTVFRYLTDIRRLWHLHEFYHHLLGIPDIDLQTIAWERVVEGLMNLRNANPETAELVPQSRRFIDQATKKPQSKQRMDAHDIANRLMRRDNYYIAMVNKEQFDFSLPLPFLGNRQFYSKSLEWCIGFCFTNFIFDEHGHVQLSCLEVKSRKRLVDTLRRRLRFAAIVSIVMAPFNIGAQCIYYFSRYYAEFRNSPAQLGARAFTPLAEWKMREFNELEHDFRRRMRMAYPFADRYLNQFPKDKTNQVMQFVSLVTGTIAAILGIATLLDPELFLGFEVTPGRTAFFYLSICMGIFATARGAVPDDSEIHEPVLHLIEVFEYTHYHPSRWKKQLHSNTVRVEFSALYQMKVMIFLDEILSLVVAPLILWRNAEQKRSEQIVDFFRQSTVHVDGLGHLCDYAVFNFRRRKAVDDEDAGKDVQGLREEYFGTKDDKMAMSQYYFMQRLGQYDQQQATRYQRQYHAMQMPPSFPPLSPLREAAGKASDNSHANIDARTAAQAGLSLRSPSPHRSILLDLQHKRHPGPARGSARQPQRQRKQPGAVLAEEDDDEAEKQFHDMTTSKLIEQDSDLADSWKALPGKESNRHEHSGEAEAARRPTNGVLGLLVEYSKAHAEGKGQRRGVGGFS